MSDRRRTSRFVIPEYTEGTFRLMQDVCVEQMSGDVIVVISAVAIQPAESLVLELPRALGNRSAAQVEAVSCTGVWIGDSRRHRIVLHGTHHLETRGPDRPGRKPEFVAPQASLPSLGVFIRRVPVRVRDVSTAGCQLESPDALPEGAVGQLEIRAGNELHCEPLRVCRSAHAAGSPWPWRAGAHFLALNAPAAASVRNVVARFEIIDELSRGLPGPARTGAERLARH